MKARRSTPHVLKFPCRWAILPSLLLLVLLHGAAWAGVPILQFFPDDNNLGTNNDDAVSVKQLKWYDGAQVQFFYASDGGNILLSSLNGTDGSGNNLTNDEVIDCLNRAVKTWNDCKYGDFKFVPEVLDARLVPPPLGLPNASDRSGSQVDGINIISFLDKEPFEQEAVIALAHYTYFLRDFKLEDMVNFGVPLGTIDPGSSFYPSTIEIDADGDGMVDFRFPIRNYKQAEIVETDIIIDPNVTSSLRAWPKNSGDIPSGDRRYVTGSYDIQALLMNPLGWARGLGNSMIVRSAMYPYINPATSTYPTDPYEKRKLALDDEITVAIADGKSPGGETGTIMGQVLDGTYFDAVQGNENFDEYLTQVPVFAAVRPEVLDNSSALLNGRTNDSQTSSPDDVVARPLSNQNNQGTYRKIVQVMTGKNLTFRAGAGYDYTLLDGNPDTGTGTGTGTGTTTTGGDPDYASDNESAVLSQDRVDGIYSIPGLPATDDSGTSINYAVYLSDYSNYFLNILSDSFVGVEAITPEFYGGPNASIAVGDGSAGDYNFNGDTTFENNYIRAQVDAAGRISAGFTGGPGILSGFLNTPRSYLIVNAGGTSYTNHYGNIGTPLAGMQIDDALNTAHGTWTVNGKFQLGMQLKLTDQGGSNGVPSGLQVSLFLTNLANTSSTFSMSQILDTYLIGRENPIYTNNGAVIPNEVTLNGAEIPDDLVYQSSITNPAFRAYITLRTLSISAPSSLRIGKIGTSLTSQASGTGADLISADAITEDSGVALNYNNIVLESGEAFEARFIVGFLQPGRIVDTWAPPSGTSTDNTTSSSTSGTASGDQDDPGRIEYVNVSPGKVTDGIDIITNSGVSSNQATSQSPIDGFAAGPLKFQLDPSALPAKDFSTLGGQLVDVDNDGDLDLVIAAFGGGSDPVGGKINRLYLNQQRINADGTRTFFFQDVTYGVDKVPSTADDRMPILQGNYVHVVAADFDGDGDVDLFFTNRSGSNRLYMNEGTPSDASRIGFFTDVTDATIPGMLNLPGQNDSPFRAVAGDIDGDGDFDLIISQFVPSTDLDGTNAWIDSAPRSTEFPSGDGAFDYENDAFTAPLMFAERVLINNVNTPDYAPQLRGFYFTDETLGADERFGTIGPDSRIADGSHLNTTRTNPTSDKLTYNSYDPADIDRMPPISPPTFSWDPTNFRSKSNVPSTMGTMAIEPRLGPFAGEPNLGLMSVRNYRVDYGFGGFTIPRTSKEGTDLPTVVGTQSAYVNTGDNSYGSEAAYFRNVDLFSQNPTSNQMDSRIGADGVADGYFVCINYNMDFAAETGFSLSNIAASLPASGLFAIEEDPETPGKFIRDAIPLFIGIPEGTPGDFTPTVNFENNTVETVNRGAWAGVIDNWENRSAPSALIVSDNDGGGGPLFYFHTPDLFTGGLMGGGLDRGIEGLIGGIGNSYNMPFEFINGASQGPYVGMIFKEAGSEWRTSDLPVTSNGEPTGVVSADFDHNGSQDIFWTNSTVPGITIENLNGIISGQPAANQVATNDTFGGFTELQNVISPNTEHVSMYVTKGDIDNDGDTDVVVFNAQNSDEVFLNQIYQTSETINLLSDSDATLFYEASQWVLPHHQASSDNTPRNPVNETYANVALKASVADFDGDGRKDLVIAEGGQNTLSGGMAELLLNRGESTADAVPVFQPRGADYPATRLFDEFGLLSGYHGLEGYGGFVNDVVPGDIDKDGDPDLLIVKAAPVGGTQTAGIELLANLDQADKDINSVPDPDYVGDALFYSQPLPTISTPGINAAGLNLKLQGQRGLFADFNGDGFLDIVIGNARDSGGAPNLLLFNSAASPGTFTDVSETNLPVSDPGTGYLMGQLDNTKQVAVGDFDSDGDIDILFLNESNATTPYGCRYMINDGTGHFTDAPLSARIPQFLNYKPRGVVVADFDGLGEWSEDKNHNGFLDPGEDTNNNNMLDWEDLPTEDEDLNGNGVLDDGEDGLIKLNGKLDKKDRNGDGIYTVRHNGIWDGSLDVFISMDENVSRLLLNDPTNRTGALLDMTSIRIPEGLIELPSRGCDAGDINLDGYPDIIIAQHVGGVTRPVKVYLNQRKTFADGTSRVGYFKDIDYEVPYARAMRSFFDTTDGENPNSNFNWASDVKLFDFDNDGDLDMFITGMGSGSPISMGGLDMFYINRRIGDGFNYKPRDLSRVPGDPLVYATTPSAAKVGTTVALDLIGANFDPETLVSFGSGVQVVSIQFVTTGKLHVTIQVDPAAELGPRRILVQNPSGGSSTQTKLGLFAVYDEQDNPYHNATPRTTWELFK